MTSPKRHILAALAFAMLAAPAAVLLPAPAFAQELNQLDGRWEGVLDVGGGQSLTVVLRITTTGGKTTAMLDSPDQGAADIPVSSIARAAQSLTFGVGMISGSYAGEIAKDGASITGTWSQGGAELPLVWKKKA